ESNRRAGRVKLRLLVAAGVNVSRNEAEPSRKGSFSNTSYRVFPSRTAALSQRKFLGQIIARHIWATGELSKPKPSFGCRKWRPTISVNTSRSTVVLGSNA